MEKLVERKEGKSRQVMADVVTPFCKMLKSGSQPQPHFNIEHLEAESQDRNDALEIVLNEFSGFAHRKGLELERPRPTPSH